MDLDALEAFVAFAEKNSFSAAAERIHLSQPAVHLRVQKLAADLGCALYRREGQKLVLTAAGREVLAFGREMLARRDGFLASLRGEGRPDAVTLAAGEGAWLYLLPKLLSRHARGGLAPLRALVRDADATLDAVTTGAADLGVLPLPRVPATLQAVELARVGTVLVTRPDHPLAGRRRLTMRAIDGTRLVAPPEGAPHRRAIDQALAAAGVRAEIAVEAPGWPLQLELAALGLGAALVNDFCRLPPGLCGTPIAGLPAQVYRAVRRRDGLRRPAVERVWKMLAGRAGATDSSPPRRADTTA